MLVRFIKNWALPLAMLAGTLGYFFFADISFVAPAKPYVNGLVAFLTPLLIFSQLLLTFCKVEVHELKPKSWHGWLLLFQTVSCLIVAVLLVCCPMEEVYREVFEGAMVCLICPTATAAAVITDASRARVIGKVTPGNNTRSRMAIMGRSLKSGVGRSAGTPMSICPTDTIFVLSSFISELLCICCVHVDQTEPTKIPKPVDRFNLQICQYDRLRKIGLRQAVWQNATPKLIIFPQLIPIATPLF